MGRKRTPGLYKRKGTWHIDKRLFGRRLCESTGTDSLEEAEKYLARRIETLREAVVYGVRPKRTFREAATKYLMENQHKRSITQEAKILKALDGHIGLLPLDSIHRGSLMSYIEARRQSVKTRTVNYDLQVIRQILNLAASEWIDEQGLTWLAHAPKIRLLPAVDKRQPYPLSWDEQERLFNALPSHLERMALFTVNTGCRDKEVCDLRWAWEVPIADHPDWLIFIIPGRFVKNTDDRLVVCNRIAREVVESQRGKHPTHVFSYKGKPILRMLNSAWKRARLAVNLPQVRVHDLKHTYGRRLRASGVSFETRQDLLGHRSGRVTTHYSAAELQDLYEAANSVCVRRNGGIIMRTMQAVQASNLKLNKGQERDRKAGDNGASG